MKSDSYFNYKDQIIFLEMDNLITLNFIQPHCHYYQLFLSALCRFLNQVKQTLFNYFLIRQLFEKYFLFLNLV